MFNPYKDGQWYNPQALAPDYWWKAEPCDWTSPSSNVITSLYNIQALNTHAFITGVSPGISGPNGGANIPSYTLGVTTSYLNTPPSSDFTFLHDGSTSWTIFVLCRFSTNNPNFIFGNTDKNSNTPTVNGVNFNYNTADSGIRFNMGNGTTQVFTGTFAYTPGNTDLFTIQFDKPNNQVLVYQGTTLQMTLSNLASFSSGAPFSNFDLGALPPLTTGKYGGGQYSRFHELWIKKSLITGTDLSNMQTGYYHARYGV